MATIGERTGHFGCGWTGLSQINLTGVAGNFLARLQSARASIVTCPTAGDRRNKRFVCSWATQGRFRFEWRAEQESFVRASKILTLTLGLKQCADGYTQSDNTTGGPLRQLSFRPTLAGTVAIII